MESASTSSGCQTWSLSDEGINPLDSLHGDHIIGHLADAELNQEIHLQNQEELKIAEQRIKCKFVVDISVNFFKLIGFYKDQNNRILSG